MQTMNTLRTAALAATLCLTSIPAKSETFNLSLSVGGNATFFPEASKGFLVADTAGDGFQFLGSNASYLLYGANASANGTTWGANDVVVLANLETGVFPDVGRGFDTIVLPYDSTALNPNWTTGDALILVWFPNGSAGNRSSFSHYRSDIPSGGTIGFTTPSQGSTDNIVAVGISPAGGNITLANEEFVVWLFEKIFLRAPGRDEFLENLALLQPAGNLTESGLADAMLRSTAFASQDKPVYAAHYWLGIAPSGRDSLAAAANLVQQNTSPLSAWQPFGNSALAPFGATFGMANATQFILNNSTLQSGNASVVSLSNTAFVDWFSGQVDGNGLTAGQKTELTNFMSAHSPPTTRQGALVSFLSGYFASQDSSSNEAILGAAARWLLNDRWDAVTNRPLSDAYLQLLLDPPVLAIDVNPPNAGTVTQNGTSTQNGTHHVDTHVPISATPTADYRFLNWSGNGVASPGNTTTTVFLDDDRQITANFGLILTVAYDANSSTSGTAPTSGNATFGSSFTPVVAGSLARTGYTFAGWNTAANGSGASFAAGTSATWSLSANTTLYAQWTANTLTVTTDEQGGSAIANASTTTGASLSSPGTPTRSGYAFAGWFTASSGGTAITFPYGHGEAADFTLYAQWTANSLAVSYDSQGGSTMANGTTTTGGLIAATPGTPTRAGYTFNGWFVAASGGSAITFPHRHGQTDNFTLYAQWTANTSNPPPGGSSSASPGSGGGGGSGSGSGSSQIQKSKKSKKGGSGSVKKSSGSSKKSAIKKSSKKSKKSGAKKPKKK